MSLELGFGIIYRIIAYLITQVNAHDPADAPKII